LTWPPIGSAIEMSPRNPPQREDAIDAGVKGATAALSGIESRIARNPLPRCSRRSASGSPSAFSAEGEGASGRAPSPSGPRLAAVSGGIGQNLS
jgi:hypothetical protein